MSENKFSRRALLQTGLVGASTLAFGGFEEALALAAADNPYRPFKMGIQSYSLRGYNFDVALEKTEKLGLYYWEAFQAHIPQNLTPAQMKDIEKKMKAAKIKLMAWGVQGFDGNEANCIKTFEFAKAMGIPVITADPSPESLPIVNRLIPRYNIKLAIHNHGPGSRFDKLSSVTEFLKKAHPGLGACIDTGHTLRSGEDPVEWLKVLGKRVYAVHLKDVKDKTQYTEIGKGELRTVEFLRLLIKNKFDHCLSLEYEESPENPIPGIDNCLFATRDAVEKARNMKG